MSDKETNNKVTSPAKGQGDAETGGVNDYSKLSYEEHKAKVMAGEIVTEPTAPPSTEGKEKENELGKEGKESETSDEDLLGDMKGKTIEEIQKAYIGIRKLQATQTNELGELRKYRKSNEELGEEIKNYGINATAQKLIEREVGDMSQAEADKFYDVFGKNPAKALMPLIQKVLQPLYKKQGKTDNEAVIKDLIKKNEDSLVPYDRKKVNKIIAGFTKQDGRNELFDRLGSEAFGEAYNIYFKANYPEALEKEQKTFKEKAVKEAEEAARAKTKTFTEKQGISSAENAGETTDYENMPKDELDKIVGKPDNLSGLKPIDPKRLRE